MNQEQPSTKPKQSRVKLSRILMLLTLFIAAVFGVLGSLIAWQRLSPVLSATNWHLRNRNGFILEGHTFHLPWRWDCKLSGWKSWELTKDHPVSLGESFIGIGATGKVMTLDEIQRKHVALGASESYTFHGKRLNFVCMSMPRMNGLLCDVPDTDIHVVVSTLASDVAEARTILESSD